GLVLHLAQRGERGPLVSGPGQETDRVDRQIMFGVGDDPARRLREGQDQGERRADPQPAAGDRVDAQSVGHPVGRCGRARYALCERSPYSMNSSDTSTSASGRVSPSMDEVTGMITATATAAPTTAAARADRPNFIGAPRRRADQAYSGIKLSPGPRARPRGTLGRGAAGPRPGQGVRAASSVLSLVSVSAYSSCGSESATMPPPA